MTPTWRTVAHDHGPRGEECVRAICVEYPAVERLTQRVADWGGAAQMGHPSPCTLGPNCPYCEIARLTQRVAESETNYDRLVERYNDQRRVNSEHCKDCCCARSWEALGITAYTGKSIPEEIEALRARLAEAERTIARASSKSSARSQRHTSATCARAWGTSYDQLAAFWGISRSTARRYCADECRAHQERRA